MRHQVTTQRRAVLVLVALWFLQLSHGHNVSENTENCLEERGEVLWPATQSASCTVSKPACINPNKELLRRCCSIHAYWETHPPNCTSIQTEEVEVCPPGSLRRGNTCLFVKRNTAYPFQCPYDGYLPFSDYVSSVDLDDFPIWMPVTRERNKYGIDSFRWREPSHMYFLPYTECPACQLQWKETIFEKTCLVYVNGAALPANCEEKHNAVCAYRAITQMTSQTFCSRLSPTCIQSDYSTEYCLCLEEYEDTEDVTLAELKSPYESLMVRRLLKESASEKFCYIGLEKRETSYIWTNSGDPLTYTDWSNEAEFGEDLNFGAVSRDGWVLRQGKNESRCAIVRRSLNGHKGHIELYYLGETNRYVVDVSNAAYMASKPLVFCFTDGGEDSLIERVNLENESYGLQDNLVLKFEPYYGSESYWCEAFFYPNFDRKSSTEEVLSSHEEDIVIFQFSTENLTDPTDASQLHNWMMSKWEPNFWRNYVPRLSQIRDVDQENLLVTLNYHFKKSNSYSYYQDFIRTAKNKLSNFIVVDHKSSYCQEMEENDRHGKIMTWPKIWLKKAYRPKESWCFRDNGTIMTKECGGNPLTGAKWTKSDDSCTLLSTSNISVRIIYTPKQSYSNPTIDKYANPASKFWLEQFLLRMANVTSKKTFPLSSSDLDPLFLLKDVIYMSNLSRSIAYALELDESMKSMNISSIPYIDMGFDVADAGMTVLDSRISITINVVDTILKAPLYNWSSDISINGDSDHWNSTFIEYDNIYSHVTIDGDNIEVCFKRQSNIFQDCSHTHENITSALEKILSSKFTVEATLKKIIYFLYHHQYQLEPHHFQLICWYLQSLDDIKTQCLWWLAKILDLVLDVGDYTTQESRQALEGMIATFKRVMRQINTPVRFWMSNYYVFFGRFPEKITRLVLDACDCFCIINLTFNEERKVSFAILFDSLGHTWHAEDNYSMLLFYKDIFSRDNVNTISLKVDIVDIDDDGVNITVSYVQDQGTKRHLNSQWSCPQKQSDCWKDKILQQLDIVMDVGLGADSVAEPMNFRKGDNPLTSWLQLLERARNVDNVTLSMLMFTKVGDKYGQTSCVSTAATYRLSRELFHLSKMANLIDHLMTCKGSKHFRSAYVEKYHVNCSSSEDALKASGSRGYFNKSLSYMKVTVSDKAPVDFTVCVEEPEVDSVLFDAVYDETREWVRAEDNADITYIEPFVSDHISCAGKNFTPHHDTYHFVSEDGNRGRSCSLDTCYITSFGWKDDCSFQLGALLAMDESPQERLEDLEQITEVCRYFGRREIETIANIFEGLEQPQVDVLSLMGNIVENLMETTGAVLRDTRKDIESILAKINAIAVKFEREEFTAKRFGMLVCDVSKHNLILVSGKFLRCCNDADVCKEADFPDADLVIEIIPSQETTDPQKLAFGIFYDLLFLEEIAGCQPPILSVYFQDTTSIDLRVSMKGDTNECALCDSGGNDNVCSSPWSNRGCVVHLTSNLTYYTLLHQRNVTKELEDIWKCFKMDHKLDATYGVMNSSSELSADDIRLISNIMAAVSVTESSALKLMVKMIEVIANLDEEVLARAQMQGGTLDSIIENVYDIVKKFPASARNITSGALSILVETEKPIKSIYVTCESECTFSYEDEEFSEEAFQRHHSIAGINMEAGDSSKKTKTMAIVFRQTSLFYDRREKSYGFILNAEVDNRALKKEPTKMKIHFANLDGLHENFCGSWDYRKDVSQGHWVDMSEPDVEPIVACEFKMGSFNTLLLGDSINITSDLNNILNSTSTFVDKLNASADILRKKRDEFSPMDVYLVSKILALVEQQTETDADDVTLTHKIMDSIASMHSDTLRSSQEKYSATDRILHFVDKVLLNSTLSGTASFVENRCSTLLHEMTSKTVTGVVIGDWTSGSLAFRFLTKQDNVSQIIEEGAFLTGLAFDGDLQKQIERTEGPVRFMLTLFADDALFVNPNEKSTMNNIVNGVLIQGLTEPFAGTISVFYPVNDTKSYSQKSCNFWKYQIADPGTTTGRWSSSEDIHIINATVVCQYDHLTHFGLLIDGSSDKFEKADDDQVLDVITLINSILSLVGLSGIVLTAFLFEKWRRSTGNQILMQFSCAIALKILLLYAGDRFRFKNDKTLCYVFGAALHFALLSEFCWMLIIAILQFKRFVEVLGGRPKYILLKACVCGWVFPAVPVILILVIDMDNYAKGSTGMCYPTDLGLYLGVWLPLLVIIFINTVIFVFIIYNVCRNNTEAREMSSHEALFQWRLAILLFSLLGLAWIFGFLALVDDSSLFAWLFSILSTPQGFIMFLFFIICNKSTRFLYMQAFKYWLYSRK